MSVPDEVRLSRYTDKTVSLNERTNQANAWGADLLTSVHINAGGGTGFESYIYNGSYPGKENTDRVRSKVHDLVTVLRREVSKTETMLKRFFWKKDLIRSSMCLKSNTQIPMKGVVL